MGSIVRDLIEYSGISDFFPSTADSFRQFNIEEEICVPCHKPDIEQIVKVSVSVDVNNYRVIKTPKGTSLEGQTLTGWKVMIECDLNQKVQYVADEPTQSVHLSHFNSTFSTFIVLSSEYVEGTPITITPYVEDIFVSKLDNRCILSNSTILVDAQIC